MSMPATQDAVPNARVLARLDGVHFARQGRGILSDIHLVLHAGRITTVIGPNGAGKSTIAKIVIGLQKPDRGTVERFCKRIGYVPQSLQLNPAMPLSVRDFVRLNNDASRDEADAALARAGADAIGQRQMTTLSGGERQRVLLARALLRKPELLVLDEPAQGVDVNGQDQLYALIARIRDETGCGILLISHDLHLVMAESDEVVCVQHHVCCAGTPESVSRDPAFIGIFGEQTVYEPKHIAPYIHHHDHNHGVDGEVGHVHSEQCQHQKAKPSP